MFMLLADTLIEVVYNAVVSYILLVCAFPGMPTIDLGVASTMLWSLSWATPALWM